MIDRNKIYKTRDGREVRIYSTEGGGGYPVHGAVFCLDDEVWSLFTWDSDGVYVPGRKDDLDLIEVKSRVKRTIWINLHRDTYYIGCCTTRTNADYYATHPKFSDTPRIACVQIDIDVEEGHGLEGDK